VIAPRHGSCSRSQWEAETGYREDTLTELWLAAVPYFTLTVHNGHFRRRERDLGISQHYWYALMVYIHLYPAEDNIPTVVRTSRYPHGLPRATFYNSIMPLALLWSANMSHIRWNDRLDPMNHHPAWPFFTTVIWDTTPIRVQTPVNYEAFGRNVVNTHYDFSCFLVLTGITFTGQLVFASGLVRSTAYDANVWWDTRHLHPQHPWERAIGDGHFSTCPGMNVPVPKRGSNPLTRAQRCWNEWVQLVRSRVEHINTVIKNHRMFLGEPYRGYIDSLRVFVRVTMHSTAVELRKRGNRYKGFGPWPHNPSEAPAAPPET